MKKSSWYSSMALSITLSFSFISFAQAKSLYPEITSVSGKVWYTGSDGKKIAAAKGTLLRGSAQLETSTSSQVKVQWDTIRELTLFENSLMAVPSIAWETGEAPVVWLKKGLLRWNASGGQGVYNVAMHSDLYEFIAPPADFTISMDPEKATTEVKMQKGKMEFAAMNAEESVSLESGQKVSFQGVKEEGKIAYDVLLQGRKIPRGKLGAVQNLDKVDLSLSAQEADKVKRLKDQQNQALQKAKDQKDASGQICSQPGGKLNECAWTCQDNPKNEKKICYLGEPGSKNTAQCYRRRCNANGEWAEELLLDFVKGKAFCKAQVQVGPCDY